MYEQEIAASVALAKSEILRDIEAGIVPANVSSFAELHDFVDANEYGGLCGEFSFLVNFDGDDFTHANAVQDALHEWLATGRNACTNPQHDHGFITNSDGGSKPNTNKCNDCQKPTHYDRGCEWYQHDDGTECFLTQHHEGATPCVVGDTKQVHVTERVAVWREWSYLIDVDASLSSADAEALAIEQVKAGKVDAFDVSIDFEPCAEDTFPGGRQYRVR